MKKLDVGGGKVYSKGFSSLVFCFSFFLSPGTRGRKGYGQTEGLMQRQEFMVNRFGGETSAHPQPGALVFRPSKR